MAVVLKNCVINNPDKFIKDIKLLFKIDDLYKYYLLLGIFETLNKNIKIKGQDFIEYIENVINDENMWTTHTENKHEQYSKYIISLILDIIENIADKKALSYLLRNNIKIIRAMLLVIVDKVHILEDVNEPYTYDHLISSVRTKVYDALISYLYWYKLNGTKPDPTVTALLNKHILNKKYHTPQLFYSIGNKLLLIYFLNKQFLTKQFSRSSGLTKSSHWEIAFKTYLNRYMLIYEELYKLFKSKGLYGHVIKRGFDNEHTNKQLTYHVCLGYINNWEDLKNKNNLIGKLINQGNNIFYSAIIDFFLDLERNNKLTKKDRLKVKLLWKIIYDKLSKDEIKYKDIISELSGWLRVIPKIDEDFIPIINLSLKYVDENLTASQVVEDLLRFVNKQPKVVGSLMLNMMKAKIIPRYDENDIIKLVDSLFVNKQKQVANEICDIYGENNCFFLRDISTKYNTL